MPIALGRGNQKEMQVAKNLAALALIRKSKLEEKDCTDCLYYANCCLRRHRKPQTLEKCKDFKDNPWVKDVEPMRHSIVAEGDWR